MNSSPGNSVIVATAVRFAAYIEEPHLAMLDTTVKFREEVIDESPYAGYVGVDVDDAFYSAGIWLTSTVAVQDMFGVFMAGFDIESIWSKAFTNLMQQPELSTLSETAAVNIEEERIILPTFQATMRDMNAVGSSTFIIGKTQIERQQIKALAVFSAEEKFNALSLLVGTISAYLNFQKAIVTTYIKNLQLYYISKTDIDERTYRFAVQDVLWAFTVLDFERSALAAMRKETSFSKSPIAQARSDLSKGLLVSSYAVSGAYIGAAFGNPVLGGVIGFAVGVAITLFE